MDTSVNLQDGALCENKAALIQQYHKYLALSTSEAGIPAQLIQQMAHAKLIRRLKG